VTGKRRALAAATVVALAALAAAVPGVRSPVARLANYRADPPGPHYDVPIDGRALERAGSILRRTPRATYLVYAPGASPLLRGNLHAAMALYALPARPVLESASAGWVLSYKAAHLPASLRVRRAYRLGPGITLFEVAR
jgi:hypothetical protein